MIQAPPVVLAGLGPPFVLVLVPPAGRDLVERLAGVHGVGADLPLVGRGFPGAAFDLPEYPVELDACPVLVPALVVGAEGDAVALALVAHADADGDGAAVGVFVGFDGARRGPGHHGGAYPSGSA